MISAFIPFRDWSLERLQTCIDCLNALPSITEILLVDFGSAAPLGPVDGCRVVRVEASRWCLSEANNIGIAEASNDVVLKIDADVQLLLPDETLADLAGTVASGRTAFVNLQATDFQYEDGKPARMRLRPSWGEGCCNLFSRAALIEIGGFDTRYFDYGGEDNDLCQRLRRYGRRVDVFRSDRVLHERHPFSDARAQGQFTEEHKKTLLADMSIFRRQPFRYSDYRNPDVFGPAITVAIATIDRTNRSDHLAYCLNGLAAQTVQDFEVVICENGTSPEARLDEAGLRAAFPMLDIRLLSLDEPSIPTARNRITDAARGFYIAIHDDDDFSFPSRFEDQLDCLATNDGAHGCHSSWIEFDEGTGGLKSFVGQSRDINDLLRRRGKVALHGTGFYRRDVMERMRYDESLVLSSDHHLHTRMALAGLSIPHTRKFHVLRRLHGASVSATGPEIQRDVSGRTNVAYKYFMGGSFLAAVRARKEKKLWSAGFPTMREMLAYLPDDFGAFRIDLDVEAALSLGLDPVFGARGGTAEQEIGGLAFMPAYRGYGYDTRLVLRSVRSMTAGEAIARLPEYRDLRGVDVVSDAELTSHPALRDLDALVVEQGRRRVISRRYPDMQTALAALPRTVLSFGLGRIDFFAVNHPDEGVHVLLGTYKTVTDLEHALSMANGGTTGDFMPVSNGGKRGSFNGN
ncbi:glycosyltransferase family 2 protein [Psychromarinibacter sp. S121]|uniref:glycosyltransferase family 2 protein n=1 Tax=Psychromarinibacter sp. S121 TaxID=3415127 RepID=UPI003C7D5790